MVEEGRANALSMMLTDDNVGAFADLVTEAKRAAADANGAGHVPVNILQLTHSGRYSRPHGLSRSRLSRSTTRCWIPGWASTRATRW